MMNTDANMKDKTPILVSACLIGVCCRWNGASRADSTVMKLANTHSLVPICPEQLGGLSTPRSPSQIVGGVGNDVLSGSASVIDGRGIDVTAAFLSGAKQVLAIAAVLGATRAILCDGSPSCGVTHVKKGQQSVPGSGVTAALLSRSGIEVTTK